MAENNNCDVTHVIDILKEEEVISASEKVEHALSECLVVANSESMYDSDALVAMKDLHEAIIARALLIVTKSGL